MSDYLKFTKTFSSGSEGYIVDSPRMIGLEKVCLLTACCCSTGSVRLYLEGTLDEINFYPLEAISSEEYIEANNQPLMFDVTLYSRLRVRAEDATADYSVIFAGYCHTAAVTVYPWV